MPLGLDKQYDLSWEEQDKIKRRLEIKKRLKREVWVKKWDPFLQIAGVKFDDPANTRYMDLRKKGRMPGSPLSPYLFYSFFFWSFAPFVGLAALTHYERKSWLEDCASGKIGPEQRVDKATY